MKTSKQTYRLPIQSLFMIFIQPSYLLVCTIFFIFFFIPEWWLIPLLTVIFVLAKRYISYKGVKYFFNEAIIEVNETKIRFEEIREIYVTQGFFQSKLQLATIHILQETNEITLRHIPLVHAKEIQDGFKQKKGCFS